MNEKNLYTDNAVTATTSGEKTSDIVGYDELFVLKKPINKHNQCTNGGKENVDILKICAQSKDISHENTGASCANGKLIISEKKASFRQLVTTGAMA